MRRCSDKYIWKKVTAFVRNEHLIEAGDRILIGLSGGADSVCLARFLTYMRDEREIELLAVHVNHGIRGDEADRDENFVRDFCGSSGIGLEIVREDVPRRASVQGISLEEAGRAVRYESFARIARDHGCNKVAVAHHGNDLAETMLFRMIRGTGPAGLTAMTPMSGNLVRPLLCLTRKEIEETLQMLGQDYVEDSTNVCDEYTRNYIRQQIVPAMEHLNSRFIDHMIRLSSLQADQNTYLERILDRRLEGILQLGEETARISKADYQKLYPYERGEALRRMLFHVSGKRKDIGAVHVDILDRLAGLPEGSCNHLPYKVLAVSTRDGILLTVEDKDSPVCAAGKQGFSASGEKEDRGGRRMEGSGTACDRTGSAFVDRTALERGEELQISLGENRPMLHFALVKWRGGDVPKRHCAKYFDYDKIKSTLRVRPGQSGDYIVIDTSGRRKKLRRYYIDEKIPPEDRKRIPVLADGPHVLWVPGFRSSESCRIDESTLKVLRVEITGQEESIHKDIERY